MLVRSPLGVSPVTLRIAAALLVPPAARASNLDYGCTTLPLGPDWTAAAGWKNELHDGIAQCSAPDFELSGGPVSIQSPGGR